MYAKYIIMQLLIMYYKREELICFRRKVWGAVQVKTMHGHFLSNLAVRLSNLVSGTLKLVSGAVQLNK